MKLAIKSGHCGSFEFLPMPRICARHESLTLSGCLDIEASKAQAESRFEGALYHVIVWGNHRRDIFRDQSDRVAYLDRIEHYRKRYRCIVYAYVKLQIGPKAAVAFPPYMFVVQSFLRARDPASL
jgi:hypothetical protein